MNTRTKAAAEAEGGSGSEKGKRTRDWGCAEDNGFASPIERVGHRGRCKPDLGKATIEVKRIDDRITTGV